MVSSIGILSLFYKNIYRVECIERVNSIRITVKNQVIPMNNILCEAMYTLLL